MCVCFCYLKNKGIKEEREREVSCDCLLQFLYNILIKINLCFKRKQKIFFN